MKNERGETLGPFNPLWQRIYVYCLAVFLLCSVGFSDRVPGRVSVIMTTYNRADLVMDAINSILAQSYEDYEFIIIDDGSTDGTFEFIKSQISDPRVSLHKLSKNVGMYAASNFALKNLVTGEFVTWQDSDDTSHRDRLLTQVNHINEHFVDAVSIAHKNMITGEIYYGGVPTVQPPVRFTFPLRRYSSIKHRVDFSMTRALFRTAKVIQLGGFNGRHRISMDAEFVERFLRRYPTGGTGAEQPLYFYHPRPDSLTQAKETNRRSLARRKITATILWERCMALLVWHTAGQDYFERRLEQDMYYPSDLKVIETHQELD